MHEEQFQAGQSLRAARTFLGSNAELFAVVSGSDALHQLDASIAGLDASADEQGTHLRETHGVVSRRAQEENNLVRKFMTPLSKYARAQLKGAADYAALTPSALHLRTGRLVQSGRSMASAAAPYAARLTAAKFPADFVQQLRAAADAVQASLDTGTEKRVKRTGATQGVAKAVRDGRNAIATLDALVSHVIINDERLRREWRTAKRMVKSPGRRAAAAKAAVPVTPVVATAPGAQEVPVKDAA